jgi:tetratricopeptide (TPR) repeat protein
MRPRRRSGRRWTTVGMAMCAIASAGAVGAQSLWDDPAFALYRQAVDAMDQKDYAKADALADQAVAAYPDHVLAHYLRGQAALATSRWDDAVAALTKVTTLYPGSFAAVRDLGTAYQQLGKVPEAAQAYERALAIRPNSDDTRVRLAFTYLNAGDNDKALPQLQQLAAHDSKAPEVWTALARVAYAKGDLAGSEADFSKAVALRDDGRTWFNLAVVRLRRNDAAGALQAFERSAAHPETQEQAKAEIAKLRGR